MAVVRREGTSKSKSNTKPSKKKAASRKKSSSVSLPKKRNQPPTKLTDFTCCILGEKGIGKSSLCAQFPDALTFMWEFGRVNLPIYQVPTQEEDPLDWERFKDYVDLVIEERRKSVVIDTADRCYEGCFDYCCNERGVTQPSDLGKEGFSLWKTIQKEFETVLTSLNHAGISVAFTTHSRTRTIQTRTGGEFDKEVPTCSPACEKFLKTVCDFVFFYDYHGSERALTVRGNEVTWSACGVPNTFLHKKTKEPIATFSAGESPEEAYKNLLKGFANQLGDDEIFLLVGQEWEDEEE